MKNHMKQWFSLFLIFMSFCVFGLNVMAQEPNLLIASDDLNAVGSITIQLEETKNKVPLENVQFAVVKVADVIDGELCLIESYNDTLNLNEISTANELEEAAELLAKNFEEINKKQGKIITTDTYGKAYIESLDVGVYLIYAIDIHKYEAISPFLLSIPTFSVSDRDMQYDLIVYPKHEPYIGSLIPTYNSSGNSYNQYSTGHIQTGDSNIEMYMMLCGGAVIVMLMLLIERRKHE